MYIKKFTGSKETKYGKGEYISKGIKRDERKCVQIHILIYSYINNTWVDKKSAPLKKSNIPNILYFNIIDECDINIYHHTHKVDTNHVIYINNEQKTGQDYITTAVFQCKNIKLNNNSYQVSDNKNNNVVKKNHSQ